MMAEIQRHGAYIGVTSSMLQTEGQKQKTKNNNKKTKQNQNQNKHKKQKTQTILTCLTFFSYYENNLTPVPSQNNTKKPKL